MKKHRNLVGFLFCFTLMAIFLLVIDRLEGRWIYLMTVPLLAMVYLILKQQSEQDEVLKKVNSNAYTFGFWVTFLVLLSSNFQWAGGELLKHLMPLWVIPLLAWNVGYLFSWFRNS